MFEPSTSQGRGGFGQPQGQMAQGQGQMGQHQASNYPKYQGQFPGQGHLLGLSPSQSLNGFGHHQGQMAQHEGHVQSNTNNYKGQSLDSSPGDTERSEVEIPSPHRPSHSKFFGASVKQRLDQRSSLGTSGIGTSGFGTSGLGLDKPFYHKKRSQSPHDRDRHGNSSRSKEEYSTSFFSIKSSGESNFDSRNNSSKDSRPQGLSKRRYFQ